MARLVYFLGAGAARQSGYPTTPELFTSLLKEKQGLMMVSSFLAPLQAAIGHSTVDIETLYTMVMQGADAQLNEWYQSVEAGPLSQRFLLSLLRSYPQGGSILADATKAFKECADAIVKFLQEEFWLNLPDLRPYSELKIMDAVHKFGTEGVSVFTTNYDISLEDFLLEQKISFDRGVEGELYKPEILAQSGGRKLRLVKLHGSIDFYTLSGGEIRVINARHEPGPWRAGKVIQSLYIVPPVEGKIRYDHAQLSLFEFFEREVGQADILAIIGTSFRDHLVAETLAKAGSNCRILIACGSRSNEYEQAWFKDRGNRAQAVTSHFPHPAISDWLVNAVNEIAV